MVPLYNSVPYSRYCERTKQDLIYTMQSTLALYLIKIILTKYLLICEH